MARASSDKDIRMYGPLLDALREAGGEAPAKEIARKVADKVLGGSPERDRELRSGVNAAENEVAWARNSLREAGFIDGSTRGVWRLTKAGWDARFDLESARRLGRTGPISARKVIERTNSDVVVADEEQVAPSVDEALDLLSILRNLPPNGFERLCQRILYAAGFSDVEVTKQSGDGGIDGHGVLQVNELVSFKVLFQCKRYQGSVGSEQIRNFRGAMSGRTDKGIIITTGTFTAEAQREAVRDGVPPIELVDSDKLVSLMERLGLGVKPRTVYDVDREFFAPFENPIQGLSAS